MVEGECAMMAGVLVEGSGDPVRVFNGGACVPIFKLGCDLSRRLVGCKVCSEVDSSCGNGCCSVWFPTPWTVC